MKGPHVSYTIEIDTFDTLTVGTVGVTSVVLDVVAKVVVGVIIIFISLSIYFGI